MYLAIQNIGYTEANCPANVELQPSKSTKGLRETNYYNTCY